MVLLLTLNKLMLGREDLADGNFAKLGSFEMLNTLCLCFEKLEHLIFILNILTFFRLIL